ncbi:MAG: hypothetical protein ABI765_06680 [Gemmatimonadota bacterium]
MAASRLPVYRAGMWLLFALGLLNLWVALQSARSGSKSGGLTALAIFFLCIAAGGWLGLLRARQFRRAREQQSRGDAILLLVTELKRHDEATLDRIARQGGPAGEAAVMVLQGRQEKTRSG